MWFPTLKKDIRVKESIQRRATRLLSQLRHLSYIQRFKELNLSPLLYRRRRGDLRHVFKIINGFDDTAKKELFQMLNTSTHGHLKKYLSLEVIKC